MRALLNLSPCFQTWVLLPLNSKKKKKKVVPLVENIILSSLCFSDNLEKANKHFLFHLGARFLNYYFPLPLHFAWNIHINHFEGTHELV